MALKIAFQMDNILKINIKSDTTFSIIHEAVSQGHEVYFYTPNTLSMNNGELLAVTNKIKSISYEKEEYVSLEEASLENLENMDIIWVRQDPPFNIAYITSTYLLETIKNKVVILNNPTEIRNNPEKLVVNNFKQFTPKTLITRNKDLILNMLETQKICIIKPLFEAQGNNVFVLNIEDPNLHSIIDYFLNNYKEPFIVQEFIKNVTKGDKRVLLVNGEITGYFARIPNKGIKSNMAAGGSVKATELTNREIEICEAIKPYVKSRGLFLVGLDLIDGFLTEINVTSPTGVMAVKNLYNNNIALTILNEAIKLIK